jgi:NAD(P)-dependent dehydrogenase (short-subunit alcohol dehydrogenase family)
MLAHNPFSLADKTILVTGASSGLGRQIAISSAKMGAKLIVTGRNTARLNDTFRELEGDGHALHTADLTQADQIASLVDFAKRVDGVVHSTGIQKMTPLRLMDRAVLAEVMDVNFTAPVMLTQRLLYKNAISPGGSIVLLSSMSARIGTVGLVPYSSAKAALNGFVSCVALEQAKRKIRVNSIVPSVVDTPMWPYGIGLDVQRAVHPFGLGTPDDIANAAIYLLSNASRWVTGSELVMDGGFVMAG